MKNSTAKLLVTLALISGALAFVGRDAAAASSARMDSPAAVVANTLPPTLSGEPDLPSSPKAGVPNAPMRSGRSVPSVGDWVRMWWATWVTRAAI